MFCGSAASTTRAKIRVGIASSMSLMRLRIWSVQPPTTAAVKESSMPTEKLSSEAISATAMVVCAPKISRESMSRPRLSVPRWQVPARSVPSSAVERQSVPGPCQTSPTISRSPKGAITSA